MRRSAPWSAPAVRRRVECRTWRLRTASSRCTHRSSKTCSRRFGPLIPRRWFACRARATRTPTKRCARGRSTWPLSSSPSGPSRGSMRCAWSIVRPKGCCCQRAIRSQPRSEEHTSELQSPCNLVCRLLLEKKKHTYTSRPTPFQRPQSSPFVQLHLFRPSPPPLDTPTRPNLATAVVTFLRPTTHHLRQLYT